MMNAPMSQTAVDPTEEAARLFTDLLQAAESKNPLYYHLNLRNLWGLVGPLASRPTACSMDFNAEINRLTQAVLLDPVRRGEAILPHVVLLAFQVNMESKAFYATVRNFANIIREERVAAEPWIDSEVNTRHGGLLTGRIIERVGFEIRDAGFVQLADEYAAAHGKKARTVRNATGHGNFRLPAPDTSRQWVFGEYTGTPPHVSMTTTRMTHQEFEALCRQFFAFRVGFWQAMEPAIAKAKTATCSFRAVNQMKPDEQCRDDEEPEQLDCHLENGDLCVKYRGTPLW